MVVSHPGSAHFRERDDQLSTYQVQKVLYDYLRAREHEPKDARSYIGDVVAQGEYDLDDEERTAVEALDLNQPATTGPVATTSSGSGWREWTVTAQVDGMYSGANHGFLVRDAGEGSGPTRDQSFRSREGGGSTAPQLVITFEPTG